LAYLYTLFEGDVPKDDYTLACVMLQEYVRTVAPDSFENPVKESSTSGFTKGEKRRRRGSKSKRNKRSSKDDMPDIDFQSVPGAPWSVIAGVEKLGDSISPAVDLHSHGQY